MKEGAKFLRNVGARRNIPVDAILHSHRRENLKSYIAKNESLACVFQSCYKPNSVYYVIL
jgi:thermostable 8-oxoguanine DNA glycosylase